MTEPEIKALQLHRTLGGTIFDFTPERAAEILEILALNLPKNGKRFRFFATFYKPTGKWFTTGILETTA